VVRAVEQGGVGAWAHGARARGAWVAGCAWWRGAYGRVRCGGVARVWGGGARVEREREARRGGRETRLRALNKQNPYCPKTKL